MGMSNVTNRNESCLVCGCTAMTTYRTRYWRWWTQYSICWRRRPFKISTISWIGIWVTWLIPMCDMTHSHVHTWLIPMSESSPIFRTLFLVRNTKEAYSHSKNTKEPYFPHNSLIPMSESRDLLSFKDSTVSWIGIWVIWLILCVTWLIPMFDMTHSHCVTHRVCCLRKVDDVMDRCVGRHDAIPCATWLIPMCTHDAFPCVISLIHCFPKTGWCHG